MATQSLPIRPQSGTFLPVRAVHSARSSSRDTFTANPLSFTVSRDCTRPIRQTPARPKEPARSCPFPSTATGVEAENADPDTTVPRSDSPPKDNAPLMYPVTTIEIFEFLGFTRKHAERFNTIDTVLRNHPLNPSSNLSPFQALNEYFDAPCGSDGSTVAYPGLLETVLEALHDRLGLDYEEYFDAYGIREEFRRRIMSEEFENVRGTGSPAYWCREGVRARWALLQRWRERPLSLFPAQQGTKDTSNAESDATKASEREATKSAGDNDDDDDDPDETADYVTLYRGGSLHLCPSLLLSRTSVRPRLTLAPLLSTRRERGDFSRFRALYLHPQRALAVRFAAYASHLAYAAHGGTLLRLRVPRTFLRTLETTDFWFDADDRDWWRRVVWKSRFGFATKPSPMRNFGCVRGHVSTGHGGAMLRPVAGDAGQLTAERNLMRVDGGEIGVQWMFLPNREIIMGLSRAVETEGSWDVFELGM